MSSNSRLFNNLVFTLVGPQYLPLQSVIKVIQESGGIIEASVSGKVTHVVTSFEMAGVQGNPYKAQFYDVDVQKQFETAHALHIPIVSGTYLQACISASKLVDVEPFLIFEGPARQVVSESDLDKRVQSLVSLLFDKGVQRNSLVEMSIDPNRTNTVTEATIKEAYTVLSTLETVIPAMASSSKKDKEEATKKVDELSNKFYKLVPMTTSATISSLAAMKEKLSVLESLSDIAVANNLMNDTNKVGRYSIHPVDVNYKKLNTRITPLERSSYEHDIILQFINNTQASMHSYFGITVEDIFEIERDGEEDNFQKYCSESIGEKSNNGNNLRHHRLLWHGSRTSNYVSILSQGLRIAPPEAPVTGYFLGKGVYFADMSSKSVEYCHPTKQNPYALLMLCEVALGRPFQISHTKFITQEDLKNAGFDSTKGCGEYGPDKAYDFIMPDGTLVSIGKEAKTNVSHSELKHNEYVVYDTKQIRIKYLVKIKVDSEKDVKAASLVQAN